MNIECIVCDLDETLLNDEEIIDDETANILIKAQENGVVLILASGRSYKRMMMYADQLRMAQYNGLLIDVNGTSIVQLREQKRQRISSLGETNIEEIFNMFKDENIEIQFNLDDTIYVHLPEKIYDLKKKIRAEMRLPEDYPWTGGSFGWFSDMRNGYPYSSLVDSPEEVPKEINKMTLNQDKEYIDILSNNIRSHNILVDYSMVRTSDRTIEIMKKEVSKGNALKKVMQEKNLNKEKVIVFGNAENDISMFECTSNSYVVENASDYVKQYANYMTHSNNDKGVYAALTKVLGNK